LVLGNQRGQTKYFNGSIANFRLFSKALNADQVKELYDWQKDHFLGFRSSMTLYKGNLGLGVAEPTSRLEIDGALQLSNGASTNVTMSASTANVPDWAVATTWASYATGTGSSHLTSGHANSDAYHYGESLDISEDGTYAVISANQGGTGDGTTQAGEVYVYLRTGTTWAQQAKLIASDKAIGDALGSSVAINKDGTYIAVGAAGDDPGGSMYVFTRSGTTWSQQQKLIPSDLGANEWLSAGGDLVAIDHNGERIVVSTYVHPYGSGWGTGNYGKGAAWVFKRTGTTWSQEAKLTASDGSQLDMFGDSIDMSGDGATIVGGAAGDDQAQTIVNHGSVYVFTRSGTTWTQTAKINATTKIAGEWFGSSVSIGGADWTTIAVGASCSAQAVPRDVGYVYIFTRPNASSTSWSQQQKLQASDALADGHFGYSVDLSHDGNSLMVGAMAPAGHSTAMDKAYVFTRTGTTWSEKTKFDESDVTNMSGYGNIVRISGDGKHVMVGGWQHQSYRGKAWIYTVGTTAVSSLNVGGAAIVTSRDVTASAFLTSSDIRLKENIQEYSPENLLDKLRDVQVITYTNKPLNVPVARTETQIGLSAQNILTLFPEYVDDSDTYYKMNYSKWPVLNTAAIKELTTQLQAEKAKVADLLARVTALENA